MLGVSSIPKADFAHESQTPVFANLSVLQVGV